MKFGILRVQGRNQSPILCRKLKHKLSLRKNSEFFQKRGRSQPPCERPKLVILF